MKNYRLLLVGLGASISLMAVGCQSETVEPNTEPPVSSKHSAECLVYTDLNSALKTPKEVCELNVRGQGITGALPSQIGALENLKVLNISDNNMTGLPAELGQLTQLEVLDASNNQLSGLPMELGNLNNLREFNLKGNPFSEQDLAEIVKKIPQAMVVTK
ncbi:MAG: leucine-rich repeat domain-containing protein [Candidatus Magasanikbacteria bacterium]|nr:leucine-rich repeat domain-containing protein [Candidatus Magasanikbacteria bacterium]